MFRRLVSRLFTRRGLALAAAVLLVGYGAAQAWAWNHLRAARAALAAYHPEEASDRLAACARVWGSRPEVRLLASRAARQSGDLGAADHELRACEQLQGGASDDTAFEWALTQAAAGNVREVEPYLQKRAEQSPTAAALVWEALAAGYLRVYRTLDAMACAEHWLKREPDNPRALDLRGQIYVTGRGLVRGSDDYRRVLQLDPSRKQTRWRLAVCLIDLGAYDEAAGHLEVFARDAPDDPEVAARLARCYVMTRQGAEARALLDAALARHPDHGPCLRARGQVALTADPPDLEAAEGYLRRAAAALPDDYQTNWSLAEAMRQRGKADEAKAQLARAEGVRDRAERMAELRSRKLAEQPLDPALHYEMGTLLLRGPHADVGVQWLTSALALDPDHKPSHAALADHYARTGDPARAADHRRRAAP
ncbi:tetratricopeptide repeat protein [bacterium]|nr:tetratricopeptide repeat protein [bacterium]